MTTLEWIDAFLHFDPEAWIGLFVYTAGSFTAFCIFEFFKKIINKHKDNTK